MELQNWDRLHSPSINFVELVEAHVDPFRHVSVVSVVSCAQVGCLLSTDQDQAGQLAGWRHAAVPA